MKKEKGGPKEGKPLFLFLESGLPSFFFRGQTTLKEEEEGEWIKNVKPNHPPSLLFFFVAVEKNIRRRRGWDQKEVVVGGFNNTLPNYYYYNNSGIIEFLPYPPKGQVNLIYVRY